MAAAGLALFLLLAGISLAHGQSSVPSLINYQGTLTDNLGNPVPAGYYEIQFRIWDHPTLTGAGDYIWGRGFPLHVVTNGLFNILLSDDGSPVVTPGPPQAASIRDAFAGTDRFLGLTITRNPQGQITSPVEISPRQRLVSAPYAMQAQNASLAGFAGIATNAMNAASLGNSDATNYAKLGSGLRLSVVPALVGGTLVNSALTALGTTNIGINKADPNAALDVVGNANVAGNVGVTGTVTSGVLRTASLSPPADTNQAVSVYGPVSAFGDLQQRTTNVWYTSTSDGFATFYGYHGEAHFNLKDRSGVTKLSQDFWFYVDGTDTIMITMPVAKDEQYQWTFVAHDAGTRSPSWNFFWRPLGR